MWVAQLSQLFQEEGPAGGWVPEESGAGIYLRASNTGMRCIWCRASQVPVTGEQPADRGSGGSMSACGNSRREGRSGKNGRTRCGRSQSYIL